MEEVLAALHAAGVTYGIDPVACARLAALAMDPTFQVEGSVRPNPVGILSFTNVLRALSNDAGD